MRRPRQRGPKLTRLRLANSDLPLEKFRALDLLGARAGFVGRIAGVELSHDKTTALARLDQVHRRAREELGLATAHFVTAKQLHGNKVAVIDAPLKRDQCFDDCDGLITNQRNIALGIYVADCCAIFLVDQRQRAVALLHSGKKGTELGIATRAIALLQKRFGVEPRDLVAQLSPCIRPPHYEVDFAAEIVRQCREAGIEEIHDEEICTACDLTRYYSYRAEKGRTGRMLAVLGL